MISDFTLINLKILFGIIEVCITIVTTITIDVVGINYTLAIDNKSLIPAKDSEPYIIIYQINTLFCHCEHEQQIFGKLNNLKLA